jgi:hypothetical protein
MEIPRSAARELTSVARSAAAPVTQDDNVKVSAIIVEHPPVKPALGYRFDFTR